MTIVTTAIRSGRPTGLAAVAAAAREPAFQQAWHALETGDLTGAERAIRMLLAKDPDNAAALVLLAELAARIGIMHEAEAALIRAIALVPDLADARLRLAAICADQGRIDSALAQLDAVLEGDPGHRGAELAKAELLARIGDHAGAEALYARIATTGGEDADLHIARGNLAKTTGRFEAAVTHFRAAATGGRAGEAWWSLADLKTAKIDTHGIATMRDLLARTDLSATTRLHLHFALGKALEDYGEHAAAFAEYAQGNRLRRAELPHDADAVGREVDDQIALFDADFLARRSDPGELDTAPIFIVGLPRSGSTLVEQILASHPAIEGTSELPYIPALVQDMIGRNWQRRDLRYPAHLATLSPEAARDLGRHYLAAAQWHRRTERPLFLDKLPNNWRNIGFIRLILPNARIIDVRREAMACGFSNFKQHFARGQSFAYDLADIGRYYRDYARLTAHFDALAPGTIHRVSHEALVADPEREIRALLDYLGLPFDAACLRHHENRRPVRTASAQQVRAPISDAGLEQWRKFAPWLDPLREALGPLA
ncbi:tetratricopeptide repeat-containing sulfotransferase family protein [Stakelama tenebrarum]|uniref:Tetratricopeptide repeat protein n=1 Tax=Stakelama tenebrarum TaxID=2711215 RepID=A0A6G6Y807_9SPHN|nr:sulfotransferase [Sphingosinithalassobacter tenebrarum]QIG81050.1 tetratricopeptide repeat protein [Sphingosinithalassobacter tenebrarum]